MITSVSILIVNHNSSQHLINLFESILKQKSTNKKTPDITSIRILVWDNTYASEQINYSRYSQLLFNKLGVFLYPYYPEKQLAYVDAINELVEKANHIDKESRLIILNPDTILPPDFFAHLQYSDRDPYRLISNFTIKNHTPKAVTRGGNAVNVFGQYIDSLNKWYRFDTITITGAAFLINMDAKQLERFLLPRNGKLFLPCFEMYAEDCELALYYILRTGHCINILPAIVDYIGGGSQAIKLGDFCPTRRYLACRNQVLLWAAHAQSWLWLYVITAALYIILEGVYVTFRYPRKGLYHFFATYIPALLDAISGIPIAHMQAGKYNRGMSDLEYIKRFGTIFG